MYSIGFIVGALSVWGICYFIAYRMKKNYNDHYKIPLIISVVLYMLSFLNGQGNVYLIIALISIGSIFYLDRKII